MHLLATYALFTGICHHTFTILFYWTPWHLHYFFDSYVTFYNHPYFISMQRRRILTQMWGHLSSMQKFTEWNLIKNYIYIFLLLSVQWISKWTCGIKLNAWVYSLSLFMASCHFDYCLNHCWERLSYLIT